VYLSGHPSIEGKRARNQPSEAKLSYHPVDVVQLDEDVEHQQQPHHPVRVVAHAKW
jgi:hypothetical protein